MVACLLTISQVVNVMPSRVGKQTFADVQNVVSN